MIEVVVLTNLTALFQLRKAILLQKFFMTSSTHGPYSIGKENFQRKIMHLFWLLNLVKNWAANQGV